MGFTSVLGYVQGIGAVCLPEQVKDWVVTVGDLGRDGDLLLLLAVDSSRCTGRTPVLNRGWLRVCQGSSFSEQAFIPPYLPVLSPLPTLLSHRLLPESLPSQGLQKWKM